ncbi:helix-turn-helix transcriptional regulator [Pusillimonas sp.]|uniref:helix-turn-helix transcriptional regulator n=1 Tax=Pusillimonas sp. TaxID=3040095 RepID=UPI0037CC5E8E
MGSSQAELIYLRQRMLRKLLLEDSPHHISYRPARELAAELLLFLDDPNAIWNISTGWLLKSLDVERVDGGFAHPSDKLYLPGQTESVREIGEIPSLQGIKVDNFDVAVRLIWLAKRPLMFADIKESRFGKDLKKDLLKTATESKLVTSLIGVNGPIGLLCADRVQIRRRRRWLGSEYDIFSSVALEVIAPVLDAAQELAREAYDRRANRFESAVNLLTTAEYEVAVLAATGQSYKEIARTKNRSLHTIDHQLRSVRRKLNLSSQAKLVQYFSQSAE